MKRTVWLSGLLFLGMAVLLAACMRVGQPSQMDDNQPTLFTDQDIEKAPLQLSSEVFQLSGTELNESANGVELPALGDTSGDLTAQAVLPGASGFIYYIEKDPNSTTSPWRVNRYDQSSDTSLRIYSGTREVQAVAGSVDGNIVVLSLREAVTPPNDFELYRFILNPKSIQRLTSNAVDDTNVSMSANALKVVWEQPVAGIATIFVRSYTSATSTSGFTESSLTNTLPQRQPSVSGNGQFITFVRDLSNNTDRVYRFDSSTSVYLTVFSSTGTETLEHPSITNDGNAVFYLWKRSTKDNIMRKTLSSGTYQSVVSANPTNLEHPFVTADGQFVTYGLKEGTPTASFKLYTKNLTTNQILRNTNPTAPLSHLGMMWQKLREPFTLEIKPVLDVSVVSGSRFGNSVAIDGDLIVVGADGFAFIYTRNLLGNWSIVKQLKASDEATAYGFGSSVSISGTTVVVGAQLESHDTNGNGTLEENVGAAYVFQKDQGGTNNWGEVKKLIASDDAAFDFFGGSVAISATTVVVGALFEGHDTDGNGTLEENVGAAYVFQKDQGGVNSWGQVKKLVASDDAAYDRFGESVSVSGNVVAVGATNEWHDADGNGTEESYIGAAYIFQQNQGGTNVWGEVKKIIASDGQNTDLFGGAIAINGDIVVVGTGHEGHDTNGNGSTELSVGAAYIFQKDQGGVSNWGEVKKLIASDGAENDFFGDSVSISGTTIVIGSAYEDHDTDSNGSTEFTVGAAYVYQQNKGGANNWGELKKLIASDDAENDFFGDSVSISGDRIAVGVSLDDNANGSNAGAVYVYE
jgi:FG-GAP repeat